jgi:hypothetical protein
MKHAGILHLSGGITRPFEPDKKRTCVKKGIGLQAYELPGVRDREPLLKRVPPLLMGEMLNIHGECSPFHVETRSNIEVIHQHFGRSGNYH